MEFLKIHNLTILVLDMEKELSWYLHSKMSKHVTRDHNILNMMKRNFDK
jgi:hypothetical protein